MTTRPRGTRGQMIVQWIRVATMAVLGTVAVYVAAGVAVSSTASAHAAIATDFATVTSTSTTTPTPVEGPDSTESDTPWISIVAFAILGALVGTGIVIIQRRRQQKP